MIEILRTIASLLSVDLVVQAIHADGPVVLLSVLVQLLQDSVKSSMPGSLQELVLLIQEHGGLGVLDGVVHFALQL